MVQRKRGNRRKQRLRDSDDRYRAFVKNSAACIYSVEFDGNIDIDMSEDEQFDLVFKHAYIAEANDAYARSVGFEHGDDLAAWEWAFQSVVPSSKLMAV
jgi:hypothetical protein